ncbi:hypothetical protein J4455_01225 [Candidatus Woesearchaeota archaeon]|nr:hypothetical protein [Candidatus Woesearchaeota archaeon]
MGFSTKIITITIFLILFLEFTDAANDVNLNAGLKWINKSSVERNWDLSIDELTYSILALSSNGYNVKNGIDKLKSKQSGDGSWNNRVYDTSLAIIALHENNENVDSSVNWLLSQEIKAENQGSWLVEIKTDQVGSCTVSSRNGNPVNFEVNKSRVSCDVDNNGDGYGNWIDLEGCAGLTLNKKEEIIVNCNNLGNADIYLIYNLGNSYYLLDEKFNTNFATLVLQNAYFGDFDSTAYASWALKIIGKSNEINTISYLSSNLRQNKVLDRVFLYMLTNDNVYSDWLLKRQNNFTGSWEANVFNTAFSITALGEGSQAGSKGINWLKNEQNLNNASARYGSWNNDLRDTSFVIWGIFSEGGINIPSPGSNISSNNTGFNFTSGGVCGNKILDLNEDCDAKYATNGELIEGDANRCSLGERCVKPGEVDECQCRSISQIQEIPCTTDENCGSKQYCDRNTLTCMDKECTRDDECDIGEECDLEKFECIKSVIDEGCPEGCDNGYKCQDNRCVAILGYCTTKDECDKNEECDTSINRCVPKKSGFPWWIITIIVLAVAGIVLFFAFKKKPAKTKPQIILDKGQKPMMRPAFRMEQTGPNQGQEQRRDVYDERIESELDKSIKRAKELLGKK